jgi:hypothetical protein
MSVRLHFDVAPKHHLKQNAKPTGDQVQVPLIHQGAKRPLGWLSNSENP